MLTKIDFLDRPDLVEEAGKINEIAMSPARTSSGPAAWTNPRTGVQYSVTAGGEQALAKAIRNQHQTVFGILDVPAEVNSKLVRLIGDTASRPTDTDPGSVYFDTTISKPCWFTGTIWVLADGTPAPT
jgi:hypothetical protein